MHAAVSRVPALSYAKSQALSQSHVTICVLGLTALEADFFFLEPGKKCIN